jgi:hypothetical protein
VRRRAEFEVLPNQADYTECECLFCAAYGGVGSGKTYGAQWKMWKRLRRYPLAGNYVVGADFEQLRGGYFLDFRSMLEDLLNWKEGTDFKYRDSPRPSIILTDTGARIRALSSELAERIRSTQIQSLHAEEPQTWHNGEQVWQTLVGRMRHSTRSARAYPDMPIQAWLTFNPGGNPGAPVGSWLHRLIEEKWRAASAVRCRSCRLRDPDGVGYPSWRFDLEDNYLLENAPQYVQNLRDNLPPEVWPAEIHGHWPTVGGDVYRGYRPDVHGAPAPEHLPPKALDPLRPILWTLDFNVGWMASLICQVYDQRKTVIDLDTTPGQPPKPRVAFEQPGWQGSVLYALDEIFLPNSGTPNVLAEFLNRYGEYAGKTRVVLYGDASGGARSQTMDARDANRSNWELIINGLRAAGFTVELRIQSANPGVMDRINAARATFLTGAGFGMLIDAQRCPNLIADFLGVKFKPGTNDLEKDLKTEDGRKRTHLSDAYGYLAWFEHEARRGQAPTLISFMGR